MARPDLTAQSTSMLQRLEVTLRDPARRTATVAILLVAGLLLHLTTGITGFAWVSVLPTLAAGLGGGAALGLAVAGIAATAHLVVDVVVGTDGGEILGAVVRGLVLLALGVLGAVVTRLESHRAAAQLRSATQDGTTGLLNVRAFYEALGELREANTPYAILLADIAGMGQLNEQYGHPTGTEAIRTLGHILRRYVERDDLVARLGSDEIAIALIGADAEGAVTAARRLADRLAEESLTLPDGQRFQVRAYFGVAAFPNDGADAATLLRRADHAVQDAKERGPDEIGLASPTTDRS